MCALVTLKHPQRLIGVLAVLALAGCGLPTSRIDAEDNRVFIPSMRTAFNLSEGREAPSEPQTGHAVEFGYVKARGGDSQFLAAGQAPVVIGGQTFSAPQQLRNQFDFSFADVSWRWRKFFDGRALGLEVLAGLGNARLDLAVSSTAQQASESFSTQGPQAGAGLLWRLQPGTSLQARASGFVSASGRGVNEAVRSELSLAQVLHENLGVRVGFSSWEVKGQGQDGISDFRLRFSGPSLMLEMNFRP